MREIVLKTPSFRVGRRWTRNLFFRRANFPSEWGTILAGENKRSENLGRFEPERVFQHNRPRAAARCLAGAALQLPQTGRSCLAQRDFARTVYYAGRSGQISPRRSQGRQVQARTKAAVIPAHRSVFANERKANNESTEYKIKEMPPP